MDEQKGFLTALAEPLAEAAAHHRASSPRDKNFTRAGGGAFLLVGCAYTASWSTVFLGDNGPRDVMAAFWAAVRVALFGCTLGRQVPKVASRRHAKLRRQ